jgi:hypothetical protein
MITSELHVRLQDAAGKRTFRAIASMTGQNHETVRRYMQGAAPSVEFISAFCEALGLNANWLLTGQGPMRTADMRPEALSQANPTELLTATAGNIEQLDDRVDRLEVFVSTMESRIRASVAREAGASAFRSSNTRSVHDHEEAPGHARDRARRVADAVAERPRPDDR